MDSNALVVYTTSTCGMCSVVKGWLRSWQIAHREIDIGEDADAREFVRRAARGYLSVPTLRFPDGRILVEPSRRALEAALDIRSSQNS